MAEKNDAPVVDTKKCCDTVGYCQNCGKTVAAEATK